MSRRSGRVWPFANCPNWRIGPDLNTPSGLPYAVHVSSVAMEVIAALEVEPGRDGELAVACALLHDVLEDTATTRAEVETAFGPKVGAGVAALTKDAAL